ncbi:MAG: hypothetical protein PF961_07915 [Planctomycetota bacterium]|nr:hypothetical protein [Planctomycetota bacterium]
MPTKPNMSRTAIRGEGLRERLRERDCTAGGSIALHLALVLAH